MVLLLPFNRLSLALILIAAIFASCSSTQEFPPSSVVPGAEMEVKTKTDDFGNYMFEITTEHLAHPERLSPPRDVYVVWVQSEANGIVNLGQIMSESGEKVELTATTPFKPEQMFITAEKEPLLQEPQGTEISRVRIE